ncbi:MAG: rRNA pseudouridine synthase [Mogibacterium sp.]|nr:rRNA pseudouridine synthase [Mogibacterium sp.]MBR3331449.1 rRNA pseudouridine synthase [Mogibacterium sp.]MBR3331997.1 rRNA pseudouridine synthase [Mogibacterium sp.]
MRLDKYLSDMGAGTRSELKKEIRKSGVSVDGTVVTDPGFSVSASSRVVFRGTVIAYEEFVYYMLNKPAGVISASEDGREETVVDLIPEPKRRDLFPVGRLDRDTEGLLIITNDGALSHRLLSPKHHVDKVYYVRVSGILTGNDIELFRDGLVLTDGLECLPADLTILSVSEDEYTSEAEITIREGKFHQVKRMFSSVGAEVLYLKRLSMGLLVLDPGLAPGESRRLTPDEMALLGLQVSI